MRRAPLEEGRDGLVEGHCEFYFSAKRTNGLDCHQSPGRVARASRRVAILEGRTQPPENEPSYIRTCRKCRPTLLIQVSMCDQSNDTQKGRSPEHEESNHKSDDPKDASHCGSV